MSYQLYVFAAPNTTNNDINLDCSQCSVEVGKEKSVTALISPASDTSLKWKVSDPSIVYLVSKKGGTIKVKGLKEGITTITAYHGNGSNIGNGNKSVSCTITVNPGRKDPPPIPPKPEDPPKQNTDLEAEMIAEKGIINKFPNTNATGGINVTILPKALTGYNSNQPVDVVFVVDQSINSTKLDSINKAMTSIKNKFNSNNDRWGLVTFNESVAKTIGLTNNFSSIAVSIQPSGNAANYVKALELAKGMFNDANRKKYIIFLTSGKPIVEKVEYTVENYYYYDQNIRIDEKFKGNGNKNEGDRTVYYLLRNTDNKYFYYNNTQYYFYNTTYNQVKSEIENQVNFSGTQLKGQNIKVFTLGIDTESDINNILLNLSTTTGGISTPATAAELNTKLNMISSQITSNIKLTDIKFKLKVKNTASLGNLAQYVQVTSNPKVAIEGDYAVLSLDDVSYPSDGALPTIPVTLLPLEFSKEGKYIFDEAILQYKDVQGNPKTYILPKNQPVAIEVVNQGEPTLIGTMTFASDQQVGNLVISENTELADDTFTVNYELNPIKPSMASISSTMKEIKLLQPLPEGVTVAEGNPTGVRKIMDPSGNRVEKVEIDFGSIVYNSGSFSPENIIRKLKLTAEWAVSTQLENPTVVYKNTSGEEKTFIIQAPPLNIRTVVQLLDRIDQVDYIYQGDHLGKISKIKKSNSSEVSSALLTLDPISRINFSEDDTNILRVQSRSVEEKTDYVDYLRLAPTIELFKVESGNVIDDDFVISKEDVIARIDEFIFDPIQPSTVNYYKRITKNGIVGNWERFNGSDDIVLTGEESTKTNYRVEIKGQGSFANENIIAREITIDKTIPNRPPTAGVIDNQTLVVGGDSKTIDITDTFYDEDDDQLTISAKISKVLSGPQNADQIVQVTIQNNQPVITSGTSPGEAEIEVTADDGRGGTVSTTFTVKVLANGTPSAQPIEDQTIPVHTQLSLDLGQTFQDPDHDPLKITATASDSNRAAVSVDGNILKITPLIPGTVTITVTADDGKGGKASTTFNVFATLQPQFTATIDRILGDLASITIVPDQSTALDSTEWYIKIGNSLQKIQVSGIFDKHQLMLKLPSENDQIIISSLEIIAKTKGTGIDEGKLIGQNSKYVGVTQNGSISESLKQLLIGKANVAGVNSANSSNQDNRGTRIVFNYELKYSSEGFPGELVVNLKKVEYRVSSKNQQNNSKPLSVVIPKAKLHPIKGEYAAILKPAEGKTNEYLVKMVADLDISFKDSDGHLILDGEGKPINFSYQVETLAGEFKLYAKQHLK